MAEKQRDPADDNARDRWQPDENIRGPEGLDREERRPPDEKTGESAEGRDIPPANRPGTSPWLGGG